MSSKNNKRGRSLYLEKHNPNAKKYINTCKLCGCRGYSPAIEALDFVKTWNPLVGSEERAIYEELTSAFNVLELDELGRCSDCARISE